MSIESFGRTGCNYLSTKDVHCNKCGHIHYEPFTAGWIMKRNKFRYDGEDLFLEFEKYADGMGAAMMVRDAQSQPYSVLTINVPSVKLDSNEFIVKTYSENEAISKAIFTTGWFEDTGKRVKTGFVEVPIWRFK